MKRTIVSMAAAALVFSATAQTIPTKDLFKLLPKERITSSTEVNWRQFGPGMAGYCEELWMHPTDPKTILMGPDMHVTFGSWDEGESWHTVKDFDGTGYDLERVIEVAFSHQDPDYGLAICRDGFVNITTDRGHTWRQHKDLGNCCSELAVDPTNDKVWFIGAGDFFNVKDTHRSIAEPHGTIQKRSEYGFIWKSTDRGLTWKKITKGLPESVDIGKIRVDPTNPKIVLAVTGHGLYRSEDAGESWAISGKGLPNNMPRDISTHYDAKSKKYTIYLVEQSYYELDGKGSVTVKGGVYKSVDGGLKWENVTSNLAYDMTKLNSKSMKWLFHRTMTKWFGFKPNESYKVINKLPTEIYSVFNRIRVNPLNPNEIYLSNNVKHDFSFNPGDVWKSEDGGKSWFVCVRQGLYWNEKRDAEYWASRNNPVGGNCTFSHLGINIDRKECFAGVRLMEVNNNGDVYIGLEQQTLRSKDGGKTWVQIDDNESAPGSGVWVSRGDSDLPGRQILLDTGIKGRALLCTGEHGLWETVQVDSHPDKEAVWARQLEGQIHEHGAHSVATVAVHPNDPNEIYILMFRQSHRGEFRRTKDGGKTWENLSKPINYHHKNLSAMNVSQASLMVDPKNPKNIYFCANLNPVTEVGGGGGVRSDGDFYGVYKSYDGGLTWDNFNDGIPEAASILRMAMDPKNPNKLYAASNRFKKEEGGLYVTENRGESWKKLSLPSGIRSVNNVTVNSKNGYIYIACGERTVHEPCRGGAWVSKNGGKSWELFFDAPFVWQVESSQLDPNIICVTSAGLRGYGARKNHLLNPGAYITRDGGKSWIKANRGLGQPDKITDFRPDIDDKNVFWCSLWGSGFYKATIK